MNARKAQHNTPAHAHTYKHMQTIDRRMASKPPWQGYKTLTINHTTPR